MGSALRLRGDRRERCSFGAASVPGNHGHRAGWQNRRIDSRCGQLKFLGVVEVEKCHARKMGLDYYVDLHVGVDGNISVHEGHEIAHRVKSRDSAKRLPHRRRARAHRAGAVMARRRSMTWNPRALRSELA